MKIAINTLSLNGTKAGMGNYIFNLVHTFADIDRNNEYHIFVSENNKHFFDIKRRNFKIINVGRDVTRNFKRFLWEQFTLPKYLKRHKIDVLHSPGFVIPFLSKAKNIVTIADMTFIDYPEVHVFFKRVYFRIFMLWSIRNADRVIAISHSTKKDILKRVKINPRKVEVIHIAIGGSFKRLDKKRSTAYIKNKYGINGPFILFVGMIEPRKNLKRILYAFSRLKKERAISHKLVIVGKKGWKYKDTLETFKKLKLNKETVFTGYVPDDDLAVLYTVASVLVYPCLYEGFGIPIIEAMACGCPVITSNVSSMPEVAGKAALLVNPKSILSIQNSIQKVLTKKDLRNKLISKGKINIKRFDWNKIAKKTLDIYKK